MNPLPPQAYTKETLVKAYQWLQHQSDGIKGMATNPDILVSLFLKAKMQGDSALERPSIQNFKNELRNLAGMIGEFEVVETTPSPIVSSSQPAAGNAGHPTFASGAPYLAPSAQTSFAPISTHASIPGVHYQQPFYDPALNQAPLPPAGPAASLGSTPLPSTQSPSGAPQRRPLPELDTRSWLMIQEVKNQLNLSSDQEALRVLISVGHSKVKSLMSEK